MPRKKKVANSPTALSDTLDQLKVEIPGLKSATELPVQLPDPRLEAEPPPREIVIPDTNPDRHKPRPDEHAAAVLARRPSFLPVPPGFRNVSRHESAGIRVNRGVERHNAGAAAIQFSEDRPLSRATEYDLMTTIQDAGFSFKPASRQWERPMREGMELGDNVIDATRIAKEIADARNAGRGR
jgi:hypothetical protein